MVMYRSVIRRDPPDEEKCFSGINGSGRGRGKAFPDYFYYGWRRAIPVEQGAFQGPLLYFELGFYDPLLGVTSLRCSNRRRRDRHGHHDSIAKNLLESQSVSRPELGGTRT